MVIFNRIFSWVPFRESAQRVPAPVTTYALFRDGQFVTQSIQSDKKFLALAGIAAKDTREENDGE